MGTPQTSPPAFQQSPSYQSYPNQKRGSIRPVGVFLFDCISSSYSIRRNSEGSQLEGWWRPGVMQLCLQLSQSESSRLDACCSCWNIGWSAFQMLTVYYVLWAGECLSEFLAIGRNLRMGPPQTSQLPFQQSPSYQSYPNQTRGSKGPV